MRSIRLALIFAFLIFLVFSLVTISGLVYRTTQENLRKKKVEIQVLLSEQHEERCRVERKKLDDDLLSDALMLGDLVKVQVERSDWRRYLSYPILTQVSTLPIPHGINLSPMPLACLPFQNRPYSLRLRELYIPTEKQGNTLQYFQINADTDELRSDSLKEIDRSFPVTRKKFRFKTRVDWQWDTVNLHSEQPVRRVVLKMTNFRLYYSRTKYSFRSKSKSTSRGRLPEWFIFVHVGCKTDALNVTLAELEQEYQTKIRTVDEESEKSLQALWDQLLLINLLTFGTALVGGCLLVWWGLLPLQRLSEAVSRVSPRDFRLPMEKSNLPVELRPIVGRLNETLAQLKRAFAREKQAAADISHELRTPLAAMIATLSVALRKQRSAEEYRETLEECLSGSQQMSHLVEQMLALAQLDSDSDRIRLQDINVSKLAEQCATLVRPIVELRGLTLETESDSSIHIQGDPIKMREVLTNLLHNAIEYNKPNGKIRMKVHRENGHLNLEVQDTGIGISKEAREHIFERFYRADPSRHAEDMHAGIGLALVKGYVDLMGGTIRVDSQPGEGTTFHIRLPSQDSTAESKNRYEGSHT